MTDQTATVGECNVCGNSLPVGANHAYTVCKHLFCISCLLKWHKTNPAATCPMCRMPFVDDAGSGSGSESGSGSGSESESGSESGAFRAFISVEQTMATIQEMDLNQREQTIHNYIMELVDFLAEQYCRTNPMCTYIGRINIRTIPNPESDYSSSSIDVGIANPSSYYIIELHGSFRAFRYKFGRIEAIRMPHPMFQGESWFVFRELIMHDDSGRMRLTWSDEPQLIAMQQRDVKSLRQYVPSMRTRV
jgi:hypothetical protein